MDTSVREGMPLEAFLREGSRHKFELINGERKEILPTPSDHGYIIRLLFRLLDHFVIHHRLGELFAEMTFILPDHFDPHWVKGSRIPDLLFYTAERFAAFEAENPEWRKRPLDIVPDLVIEVVSPHDSFSYVNEKVRLYLADGVRVIWVVDSQRQRVTVYEPDLERGMELSGDSVLDGGELLPGFKIRLPEIFA